MAIIADRVFGLEAQIPPTVRAHIELMMPLMLLIPGCLH